MSDISTSSAVDFPMTSGEFIALCERAPNTLRQIYCVEVAADNLMSNCSLSGDTKSLRDRLVPGAVDSTAALSSRRGNRRAGQGARMVDHDRILQCVLKQACGLRNPSVDQSLILE